MSEQKLIEAGKAPPLSVVGGWAPIDSAPKNGDEILGFREDCGIILMRWIAPCDFLTDREIESMELAETETEDWFCADFVNGGRLDGDLAPTHWHPLPALPNDQGEPQLGSRKPTE